MQQTIHPLASSFRDPSGFVFIKDGTLYRQVNRVFKADFDHFIQSGCYDKLVSNNWLIAHEELPENLLGSEEWYKTVKPRLVPFISFSYEWCFDMLKDAALLTLQLAKECLPFGIILKDATPFNIQWENGKPIFIDTLSFEKYDQSKPWIAYRQFCESFLAPLLLMYYCRKPLQSILLAYPDGIPLSIASALLPWRSKFSFHTYLHIHLHERLAAKNPASNSTQKNNFSEKKLMRLLDSLQSLIRSMNWKSKSSTWANYYSEADQRGDYLDQKKEIITKWIDDVPQVKTALDLGANNGQFSLLLAAKKIDVVATDFDHEAINKLYNGVAKSNQTHILPLLIDLSNPSPGIGVNNNERPPFTERVHADLSLALALVHHLVIGKNIPFQKIAEFFSILANNLIIEFIPKTDEKVQFMLTQKNDIYRDYNEQNFVTAFEQFYFIQKKQEISRSGRILYMMKKHG